MIAPGAGCFCPGDCGCNAPEWMHRPVFCGCRQHGVTVRETLHHGNTRDTRETTVPDLSPASVARVLARSLYAYDGMGAARVAAELVETGKGDHGWSRFEVL